MKTVRQIADEIGATKQALQKRMSREPLYTRLSPYIDIRNGTKYIDETGERIIVEAFIGMDKPIDKSVDTPVDKGIDKDGQTVDSRIDTLLALVSEQQQTIKDLTAANRELTAALENTTDSLKAAQALHAGTMHKQLTASNQEDEQPGRNTGKNVTGDGLEHRPDKPTVEISPKEEAPPKKGGFFSKWFGKG